MSKSLGNVIDPLHVIRGASLAALEADLHDGNLDPSEISKYTLHLSLKLFDLSFTLCRSKTMLAKEFPSGIKTSGADALRFTLIEYTQNVRQLNLDINRVYSSTHFGNKIWNLFRYSFGKFDQLAFRGSLQDPPTATNALLNQFILSRLADTVQKVDNGFKNFELNECTTALSKFIVGDLCDVFVEFSKPVLSRDAKNPAEVQETANTLWICLLTSLKLLHPIMPHLTEVSLLVCMSSIHALTCFGQELWQHSKRYSADPLSESIMIAQYPDYRHFAHIHSQSLEASMRVTTLVSAFVLHAHATHVDGRGRDSRRPIAANDQSNQNE